MKYSVLMILLMTNVALANSENQQGEKVYQRLCSSCHGFSGEGRSGLGPGLKGAAIIKDAVLRDAIIRNGRTGTLMVGFSSNLSEQELTAVSEYIASEFAQ